MMTPGEIAQEIEALTREATETFHSLETYQRNAICVTLLRHGYRLIDDAVDGRLLHIIGIESQRIIYTLSRNELRHSLLDGPGWLAVAQRHEALPQD